MAVVGAFLVLVLVLCIVFGGDQNAVPMLIAGAVGLALLVGSGIDAMVN